MLATSVSMVENTVTHKMSYSTTKPRVWPQCPEYAEVCKRQAIQNMAWLDEALADRKFIAGDRYTVADITALCGVDFGKVSKITIQPDQKNLARWYEEVSARPSAKA